ncbi:MAG: carboxylesterase family protein [Methanoregula sp.]|nr:carboxylesterase family protein [Methanoregula sp.]
MHLLKISYVVAICLILTGGIFLAGCTQKEPASGIVKTDAGSVSGLNEDSLQVYLGIPYAAPPTGDLRWRPPAPVQPWNGTKETTRFTCLSPAGCGESRHTGEHERGLPVPQCLDPGTACG